MQAEKKQFQVQLFQGVEHGFALRGNPNDPYEREYCSLLPAVSIKADVREGYTKEQSLKGIAEWFDFWLNQDSLGSAKL
jgi:hypothetical protein